MKKAITEHYALASIGLLGGVIFIYLVIMSLLNRPIADDVAYFRYFEIGNALDFMYWHYFEHTGRLLQSVLVASGYLIAGDASVKIMPAILYTLLTLVMSWTLYRFIPWARRLVLSSAVVGLAISSAIILLMPSTYDSYLWWTSSSIYLSSLVVLLFTICAVHLLLQNNISTPVSWLLLLIIFIGQTLSEITSVILIGSAAITLGYFILRKDSVRAVVLLKVFGALVAGFFVTYFSPGSIARRTSQDGEQIGFDFVRVFVLSTKHTFELIASLSLWEIALMMLIGLAVARMTKPLSVKAIRSGLFAILVAIIIGIYGAFCVNNFVWYNMPYRALSLPSLVLTLCVIAAFYISFNFLLSRYRQLPIVKYAAPVIIFALLVPSLFGAVRFLNSTVTFMSARNDAYPEREENIAKQLASNPDKIEVEALPILVKSQATDLIYGAEEQIVWYENALKGHNGIPKETEIIVIAPPPHYCTFGTQDSDSCVKRGDNTTLRRVINKINEFMVYYFSVEY